MGVEFSPQEVIEFLGGRDEFRTFLKQKVHTAEVARSRSGSEDLHQLPHLP